MKLQGLIRTKNRRGQMFILATMLIAVYIVTMTATLMNLGAERIEFDRETLREPYLDSKRELQHFMEFILADYTKNGTNMTPNSAIIQLEVFLTQMEAVDKTRGVKSEFQLLRNSFNITANQSPYENISDGTIYSSYIYAEFKLKMSSVSSSITIDESFSISFVCQAEVQSNRVIIQEARGNHFDYSKASSIYILNGSNYLIPSPDSDHTGIYNFEGFSNLSNLGILNVTLMNRVCIFS